MMPGQLDAAPSIPVFAEHVEAKAAEALNVLIFAHGGGDAPIHAEQLIPIRASLTALVDCLFPCKGDYADFSGADSLDGIDYTHPTRVAMLAVVIGRTLGMARSELVSVAMAGALMNVGYLALRRSLLDEPRRLLEGEWEEHIHTHPSRGTHLLARSDLPDDCLWAIAQHHERWNGSGYPAGLRGEAISHHARILAVADTYVSLRSVRPHRLPVDAETALEEVVAGSGRLFDPVVIDSFEDAIARFTGVVRPARASVTSTSVADAAADEYAASQRNAANAFDAAAPVKPDVAPADKAEEQSLSRPRIAREAQSRISEPSAGDRPICGAPPPANAADTAPPAPLPRRPLTKRRATVRRHARRLLRSAEQRHGHGLFSPAFYVEAALRGHWPVDRPFPSGRGDSACHRRSVW